MPLFNASRVSDVTHHITINIAIKNLQANLNINQLPHNKAGNLKHFPSTLIFYVHTYTLHDLVSLIQVQTFISFVVLTLL